MTGKLDVASADLFPLTLQSETSTLQDTETLTTYGQLDPLAAQMLNVLLQESSITLQLQAYMPGDYGISHIEIKRRLKRLSKQIPQPSLHVIIYGARHLFELIGLFVSKYGYFIQQPYHCDRVVEYCNPHCLSPEFPQRVFTQDQQEPVWGNNFHAHRLYLNSNPIDAFADSSDCSALPETEPPLSLKTPLYRFATLKRHLSFILCCGRSGGH